VTLREQSDQLPIDRNRTYSVVKACKSRKRTLTE
jgi:hypothetical protein